VAAPRVGEVVHPKRAVSPTNNKPHVSKDRGVGLFVFSVRSPSNILVQLATNWSHIWLAGWAKPKREEMASLHPFPTPISD